MKIIINPAVCLQYIDSVLILLSDLQFVENEGYYLSGQQSQSTIPIDNREIFYNTTRRRSNYTLEFKLKVIDEAKKDNNSAVARMYGICESLVRTWRRNEDKILLACDQKFH